MLHFLSTCRVEVDIHSMHQEEAKKYLEHFLSDANGNVKEVVVIHGYSSGTVLRDMVRKRLKHHRIRSKALSLNPGITTLYLF
ncbi:MAG: Smr/MutS family protein [Ethanoligenens sp.]|uniref:Smr/MutS family protein n=1 Tax=Ethanoligenens sp. TaxID=2099655 RepID=UPI0039EBBE61